MLNQPVSLDDLDAVILDFGGVLYDIDYDAPPKAFAALGDSGLRLAVPSGRPIDVVR